MKTYANGAFMHRRRLGRCRRLLDCHSEVSEWRNPAYTSGSFKRIMIGGPGEETSVRRNFEDEFLAQFRAAGIDALPSYRYMAEDERIDETKLKQAAQKAGA
ncbi:MAG TPA: hypothetical protein VGK57_01800, partial [Candidatus Binatia bacterium]